MIYLFTWNSEFLVKQKVQNWKNQFVSKYWDFNLLHIKNFDTVDNNFLTLNITSTSFLSEKKLVIIDIDAPSKKTETETWDNEDESSNSKLDYLASLFVKIPDDNILLISAINPDKRTKFYKAITKIAKIEEFNIKDNNDIYWVISKNFDKKISREAIETLISYKSWNLSKIMSEIEKLLITFDYINKKEIVENIVPELEESIFQLIDDILNKNIVEATKKMNIILNDVNVYAFYNNLLANLRTSMYISHLKNLWQSTANISETLNLGNKTFLITKNYRINNNELKRFYIRLLNLDKKMKSWKLMWTEDSDFKYELENELIKIISR